MYSTKYSVYNFFNNSFWTQKKHANYFNNYDIPDITLVKRKNYGFYPDGIACWLKHQC